MGWHVFWQIIITYFQVTVFSWDLNEEALIQLIPQKYEKLRYQHGNSSWWIVHLQKT